MYDRTLNTPQAEIENRIAALQGILASKGLDGVLIMQRVDLFYFTGTIQQGSLYVPAAGEPLLMVNKVLARAKVESSIARIVALKSPRDIPDQIGQAGLAPPRRLGLELDVLPTNLYFSYRDIFKGAEVEDQTDVLFALIPYAMARSRVTDASLTKKELLWSVYQVTKRHQAFRPASCNKSNPHDIVNTGRNPERTERNAHV